MKLSDLSTEARARVSVIVEELLDLPAPERQGRADILCGGDAKLRAAVDAVVGHATEDDTPFRAAVRDAVDDAAGAVGALAAGERVGAYRLVRPLGHGGMGTVYLASRADEEFEQEVAIKVVRGLFGPDTLRRFRAERQTLATLVHPHIARLLDGGTTAEGIPYLVMEYVDGSPLDEHCRTKSLGVRERLALFAQVCDAVAYAHSRLIVHRDLKPTNILVTPNGIPKLLDFGIAKLLGADESDDSPVTVAPLLTPEYASPEQTRGETATTATDVYSLGVVLHELLMGERPDCRSTSGDHEPQKPSAVAARAGSRAVARRRELVGDLDSIVLCALERDPARRYRSAEALSDDIRRYLAGEPVRARAGTFTYRAARFVARHRVSVAAAVLLMALGIGWGVTTVVQAASVARERDTALEVTSFLVELFASSDPAEARSHQLSARELIDRGAAQLPRLAERPEIHVRLLEAIGRVYRSLAAHDRAVSLFEQAVQVRGRLEGRDTVGTAAALNQLAEALREQRGLARAEQLHRESLAVRQRLLGPRHSDVAHSLNNLALTLRDQGKLDDAEPLFQGALAIWRERGGPGDAEVAVVLMNLSLVARDRTRYKEAEAFVREALEIRRRVLPDPDPRLANSLMSLGQILDFSGDDRAAVPLIEQALEMRRKIYGDRHPVVTLSASNLATVKQDLGDLAGAEALYRSALATEREVLGRHVDVAVTANNLASLLEERGQYPEAEALFRESLTLRRELLGPNHQSTARAMHNLARLLFTVGRLDESEPLAREALALRRGRYGEVHVETAGSLELMGRITAARGHRAEGEATIRDALARFQKLLATNHPTVHGAMFSLALVLLDDRRPAEAEPLLRAVTEERRRRLPDGHWQRAVSHVALGRALRALGRTAEATSLIVEGHRALASALPAADPRVAAAARLLP